VTSGPVDAAPALPGGDGRGVRILIIDSGVEASHPQLAACPMRHYAVEDADGVSRVVEATPDDPVGHGTAVASIVHRLAPAAELTSLRVLGKRAVGTTRNLFVALEWAASRGFDIINTSLGTTYLATLAEFKRHLDALYLRRAIVVSACSNLDPEIIEYPAHFTSVVSVAHASLEAGRLERTEHLVEFRAPGVDVEVAWRDGATRRVTGSSFAAPHVTALVARLRERLGPLNATQVKSMLYDLAVPDAARVPEGP
jgi:subtilisin